MQAFLVSFAIKFILQFLLSQVSIQKLLSLIGAAEELFEVPEEKRNYVREQLKNLEADNKSDHMINFILEAAVVLYKNYK